MTNIHEETQVQCINTKNEDQMQIEIRIDFFRAVVIDTCRESIALMISVANEFRNHTLL